MQASRPFPCSQQPRFRGPALRRAVCIWTVAAFALGDGVAPAAPAMGEDPLSGHFVIAESLPPGGGSPYNGTVDITPKRPPLYSVNWRLDNGKRLRGLALRDGDDFLGVTLNTGGAAYGLAIYRRDADGKRWRGPWISSIDGGSIVGEIGFDAGDGPDLPGRHTFTGRRGRMGEFSGTVNIAQRGEGFLLNFTTSGGTPLYRGIGVRCGDDRLAVAWSFGGTPSVAVYQPNQKHGMAGRRLSLPRSREEALAGTERLTREGYLDDTIFPPLLPTPGVNAPALPTLPPSSSSPTSATSSTSAAPVEPPLPAPDAGGANPPSAVTILPPENSAPDVKTLIYADLLRRHYRDGLAARWLSEQLSTEERALLESAVKPQPGKSRGDAAIGRKTVTQLIEEQRAASKNGH